MLDAFARDQVDGLLCCARVPRRQLRAVGSSLTSLRTAPRQPDPSAFWLFDRVPCQYQRLPKMPGGGRSEVKEEARAKPGTGDMSGGGLPASSARAGAGVLRRPSE